MATKLKYEVREVFEKKTHVAFGVYEFAADKTAKPLHVFPVDKDDSRVAHYLACQMANDMNNGVDR
jgi:hypothetical protein